MNAEDGNAAVSGRASFMFNQNPLLCAGVRLAGAEIPQLCRHQAELSRPGELLQSIPCVRTGDPFRRRSWSPMSQIPARRGTLRSALIPFREEQLFGRVPAEPTPCRGRLQGIVQPNPQAASLRLFSTMERAVCRSRRFLSERVTCAGASVSWKPRTFHKGAVGSCRIEMGSKVPSPDALDLGLSLQASGGTGKNTRGPGPLPKSYKQDLAEGRKPARRCPDAAPRETPSAEERMSRLVRGLVVTLIFRSLGEEGRLVRDPIRPWHRSQMAWRPVVGRSCARAPQASHGVQHGLMARFSPAVGKAG